MYHPLELLRRSMVGSIAESFPTFASLSNSDLFGILIGLTLAFGVAAVFIFRFCDHRARERGMIDRVTNY